MAEHEQREPCGKVAAYQLTHPVKSGRLVCEEHRAHVEHMLTLPRGGRWTLARLSVKTRKKCQIKNRTVHVAADSFLGTLVNRVVNRMGAHGFAPKEKR